MQFNHDFISKIAERETAIILEKLGATKYESIVNLDGFSSYDGWQLKHLFSERIQKTCVEDSLWKGIEKLQKEIFWFEEETPFFTGMPRFVESVDLPNIQRAKEKFSPVVEGGEEFFNRLADTLKVAVRNTFAVLNLNPEKAGYYDCDSVVQGRVKCLVALSSGGGSTSFYKGDLKLINIRRGKPEEVLAELKAMLGERDIVSFTEYSEVLRPYGITVEASGGGVNGYGWFSRPLVGREIQNHSNHSVNYEDDLRSPTSYANFRKNGMRFTAEQEEWLFKALKTLQEKTLSPEVGIDHVSQFESVNFVS